MEVDRKHSPVQLEYGPVLFEYRLMREYVLLQEQNLTNVYVIPSHSSPLKWFGVLFVHDGLFQGAIHRFTIRIPTDFPSCCTAPEVIFEPVPFHPLVHPMSGQLCSKIQFPGWDTRLHKIWQLVLYVKRIFFSLESDVHLVKDLIRQNKQNNSKSNECNGEAVRLFFEDYEGFESRISDSVQQSRARLYEVPADADDRNAIIFGPWNPETHESTRRAFLSGISPDAPDTQSLIHPHHHHHQETSGLSWVQVSPAVAQFRSFS